MSKYVLDANAFIEARDRYYAYDLCPGYWTALLQLHGTSRVCSIDRIQSELVPKQRKDWDDIARWIDKKVPDSFFKKTEDKTVIAKYQEIVNWVYDQGQFTDAAKAQFASAADGWLVAFAAINGLVVVTHEQYRPDSKSRVMIPNVCIEFDVDYVNTFDMLRALKVKFVRSTKRTRK